MHWREFQQRQKVVEVGDRFVSYVDEGEGPPVVLVHGVPTWGYLWHRVLPALVKSRRVLIPDLPGFGWSDRSDGFDRSAARQARLLSEWLRELGVARADFVGHDAGAAIVLRLAALEPARADKLCLLDALAYDGGPHEALSRLSQPRALREALRAGFANPDDELIEGLLAPYATDVGRLSLARGAAALDPSHFLELQPLLPSLGAPTLVLWGERDAFQPLSRGRRLAWDLPRSRFAVVEGAGHYLPLDKPAETAARLRDFLALGLVEQEIGAAPELGTAPFSGRSLGPKI